LCGAGVVGLSASPPTAGAIGGFPMNGKRPLIAAVRCRCLHVRQPATGPRRAVNARHSLLLFP
jgi:hypothetical protein